MHRGRRVPTRVQRWTRRRRHRPTPQRSRPTRRANPRANDLVRAAERPRRSAERRSSPWLMSPSRAPANRSPKSRSVLGGSPMGSGWKRMNC
ncbi:MAG: hypothetical protein EBR10_07470 [Planctomycetes bacterium]|nr:hypothetical protein [Planctomycetota bacterium]